MSKQYDTAIKRHYTAVAAESGSRPTSTMADEIVRSIETDIVTSFVAEACATTVEATGVRYSRLIDVGCGNGSTLSVLRERFRALDLVCLEYTQALREIDTHKLPEQSVTLL